MSKTYRKNVRQPIAVGDNRSYYKTRRRNTKRAGKNNLRSLMSNYDPEEVENIITDPEKVKKDTWREPTDGYVLVNKDIIKKMDKDPNCFGEYYHQKYDRVLKNKHYKH